jgi:outer membrane protein assembly factor BamD (BamD/ComL family)
MSFGITPGFLRVIATIFLFGQVVLTLVALLTQDASSGQSSILLWALLLVSVGVAFGMLGIARLLQERWTSNSRMNLLNQSVTDMHADLAHLSRRLAEMHEFVTKLRPGAPPTPAAPASAATVHSTGIDAQQWKHLHDALDEIKELSLLPDEQRRTRLTVLRNERKLNRARLAIEHIERREWGKAEKLIKMLESEHPGDADLVAVHRQLRDSRAKSEHATITKVRDSIDEYIATERYDQAYVAARQLVEDFPLNADVKQLLDRVSRERELWREATGVRLFEEIRANVEWRHWRTALALATRLIDEFPDHRRTEQIRAQYRTIQENAEIEERQEIEIRIQEMIRSGDYTAAIELGEDLIRRYPDSPQAESLDQLLPRIRQLSVETRSPAV